MLSTRRVVLTSDRKILLSRKSDTSEFCHLCDASSHFPRTDKWVETELGIK
ncbi:hypothetical protein TanjilG_09058 [Lupinus angustifolius]|uniref:Uncharacterized protein n=1 Tax=Lupinus angustifolius TaxID=3871 RepID=A0A1J7HQN9_LUPAN|nr:hypothetical protein TanjilG_09058 [Lupinus angustifolius]